MSQSWSESDMVPVKRVRRLIDRESKHVSRLCHFPNEIFLQIFEFLDLHAIVKAFFGINKRYDSLLSSLKSVSLVVASKGNVSIEKNLCQYSAAIVHFVVDRVPKFTFTCTTLTNIRSLTIKYGTQNHYDSVRPFNFPLLEYLHIEDCEYNHFPFSE